MADETEELHGAAEEAHEEKVETEHHEVHEDEDGKPATRGDIKRLSEKVESLSTVVTELAPIPNPSENLPEHEPPAHDESPAKPPWHKRRFL